MNDDRKATLTLEQLLRLKRAERPAPEFWAQFESELRAKQLAAIVEKRPRWAGFSRLFAGFSRLQVPLGAAAAVAVTFGGYHEYGIYTASRVRVSAPIQVAQVAPAPVAPVVAEDAATAAAPLTQADATATQVAVSQPVPTSAPADVPMTAQTSPSGLTLETVSVRNEFASRDWTKTRSPSSHSIDLTLTSAGTSDNELVPTLFAAPRAQQTALLMGRRSVAEPLEQMTSPNEERRSRLMAEALPAVARSSDLSEPSSDHYSNRLDDDRMYRSISRYNMGDDKLSLTVKF